MICNRYMLILSIFCRKVKFKQNIPLFQACPIFRLCLFLKIVYSVEENIVFQTTFLYNSSITIFNTGKLQNKTPEITCRKVDLTVKTLKGYK